MMVNLASVDEETENETPAEAPKETLAHDEKEEKVRVDRRKLEQMLQANGDGDRTIAEEFFSKVMLDTSTRISWPSKLKIGAKSKKDPHIKIAGLPESVKKAKEMVVAKLESKANRVTLKMDVSHTDHSHIIGRRGQSIKTVMGETGCHIHFPDSNRGPTNTEKSNQVSIAGQPEGVEKARTRIRELLPLVLMFEVPLNNAFLPLDPLAPSILTIAQRYDVTFTPRGTSPVGYLVVAIRGSQDNISNIQEAMGCLCKHLTGRFQIPNIVSLQFDIAPQHHMFVVGRAGCNIKEITDATGAKFEFPDPSVVSRKGNVTITGSVNAVIQARAMLVKLLPLLLMFDLKEEEARSLENEPDKLKKLMDKFNVTIMVKPKPKQPSKSVVIKSKEINSQNMYLTRLEVLGTPMDPYATRHPSFDSFHRHVHGQTNFPPTSIQAWYPGIGQSPYSSPTASPTPCLSDSTGRMRSTPSPTRLPPGFEPSFKHDRSESFTNGETRERSQTGESQRARSQGTPASDGGSPKQFSEYGFPRRNSEPTPIGESWSSDQAILDLKKSNGSISSLVPSEQKPKFALYEGAKNADKRLSHPLLDSHGSNLASSGNSLTSSLSYNFDHFLTLTPPQQKFIDYEEQISKANKLMTTRKVIHPQVRTPTDQWSGLHLSKSTPDGALRKPIGKSQSDSRLGIPSTDELPEPDSTPSVRQDFSASFQSPSHLFRRGVRSPFSEQNFLQSLDCESNTTVFHQVLKLYGVENFAEVFERQEIDFATFLTLTKEDLKEAGVEPLGARKKMEHAIEYMKKLKDKAIKEQYQYKAQSFHVTNPMDFNSQSGRW